jgi:hypothetical protein
MDEWINRSDSGDFLPIFEAVETASDLVGTFRLGPTTFPISSIR